MTEIDTTWTPPPWEPPLAGIEAEQLIGALDRMRATFRFKVDGLDAAGTRRGRDLRRARARHRR